MVVSNISVQFNHSINSIKRCSLLLRFFRLCPWSPSPMHFSLAHRISAELHLVRRMFSSALPLAVFSQLLPQVQAKVPQWPVRKGTGPIAIHSSFLVICSYAHLIDL